MAAERAGAVLQIALPHKCDRCINMKEALVEALSLCSTLGQDENRPLPLVGAKHILGKQLAEFSSARFDRSDLGGDPLTLREKGLVHAQILDRVRGNSM